MASRPLITPYQVITNGDMTTTVISIPTIIQNTSMVSYDISWAGSGLSGTIQVQVSNTYSQNSDGSIKNAGNWTSLVLSNPTLVTTDTGAGFIDLDSVAAYAIRLVYTPTAGSGALNATLVSKVA